MHTHIYIYINILQYCILYDDSNDNNDNHSNTDTFTCTILLRFFFSILEHMTFNSAEEIEAKCRAVMPQDTCRVSCAEGYYEKVGNRRRLPLDAPGILSCRKESDVELWALQKILVTLSMS